MFEFMTDFVDEAVWELLKNYAALGGLIVARVLPVVIFTPILGGQTVPARLRFGGAVVIGMTLATLMNRVDVHGPYVLFILKEVIVGAVLAFAVGLVFHAFAAAGSMIDSIRGATSAQVLAPHIADRQSAVGSLLFYMSVALFVTLDGHQTLIGAFAETLRVMPPQELAPAGFFDVENGIQLIELTGRLFSVALRLAAPVILVIMMLDVILGLVNRVAPQIQVFFLGMTVKGALGIALLFVAFGFLTETVMEEFVFELEFIDYFLRQ